MNWKSLFLILPLIFLASCSDYNKLLKSQDIEKKYAEAVKYYEKGDCIRSLQLFDELLTIYKGTPKAESIYYYYAYSNYCVGDYLLAAYHFKTFVKNYPASKHAEECAFMAAVCYYNESPRHTLDQTDTRNAIRELQNYINKYPQGTRLDSCNKLIDKLRGKLERKDYETALQYYHMEDYKSAIAAMNNLLKKFPDTKFREEATYYILRATYDQALRSIDDKKIERLTATIDLYNKYENVFSENGKYRQQASFIGKSAVIQKERFSWEIPFSYFEAKKYSKAIEGFKTFISTYPNSSRNQQAMKYMSEAYYLLIELAYQNIDKQYGVNNVVNSYREYVKHNTKFKSQTDPKYSSSIDNFAAAAPYIALSRVFDQLEEYFRLQDVNALVHYKTTSDFFTELKPQLTDASKLASLEKQFSEIQGKKEEVEKEIGFWLFERKSYEKSR